METKNNGIERSTLTADETADYIGVSRETVYKLVREKRIKHIRIGNRILFRRTHVENFLTEMER